MAVARVSYKGSFVRQLLQVCPALTLGREARPSYGTRKGTVLESVPLGVASWTFPVVAPAGTVVVISGLETTVNKAAAPVKVTLVPPVRPLPRMLRAAPTLPERGRVFTNGPKPTDRLKTEPSSACPDRKSTHLNSRHPRIS